MRPHKPLTLWDVAILAAALSLILTIAGIAGSIRGSYAEPPELEATE